MALNEVTGYQAVGVDSGKDSSRDDRLIAPYLGPSTSTFCGYEMPDLETASKNHISDANEIDIEEETKIILKESIDKSPLQQRNEDIDMATTKDEGCSKPRHRVKREDVLAQTNWCTECSTQFDTLKQLIAHDCGINYLFRCDQCQCRENLDSLDDLLSHIKVSHPDTQVPGEYVMLLNKQLQAIEKVKNTAFELMNANKLEAVYTLLESSKKSLDSIKIDIFGKGETNVFKMYTVAIYKEVFKQLSKLQQSDGDKIQRASARLSNKRSLSKKTLRSKKKKDKKKRDKIVSNENDFSSEDDLCLKDSILMSRNDDTVKIESPTAQMDDCDELYLQFYAVPYKLDGSLVSLHELECLRVAVRSLWDGVYVDMADFDQILVKRVEREIDEVLPDDAVYAGYAAKENTYIFNEPIRFCDVFDENFMLKDVKRPHKSKRKGHAKVNVDSGEEGSAPNGTLLTEDENGLTEVQSESDSNDSYDDGFYKATEFLTEFPSAIKRCSICDEIFPNTKLLTKHIDSCHGDSWKRLTCKYCHMKFLSRIKLWKHLKTHTSQVFEECELCCETFMSIDDKKKHVKHHSDEEMKCAICKMSFKDYSSVQKHFAKAHRINPIELTVLNTKSDGMSGPVCTICNRNFTSAGRLTQHLATKHHKGIKTKPTK